MAPALVGLIIIGSVWTFLAVVVSLEARLAEKARKANTIDYGFHGPDCPPG